MDMIAKLSSNNQFYFQIIFFAYCVHMYYHYIDRLMNATASIKVFLQGSLAIETPEGYSIP